VGNGYGYDFVPVAGNGYEFGYVMKVVGTNIQRYYLWIIYLLPSLTPGCSYDKKKRQAENRLNTPPAVEVMQKNTPKCCHTQATEEYSEETLLGCNLLSRQRHVYMQHLTNVPSQS
jgi:hypothetical protein